MRWLLCATTLVAVAMTAIMGGQRYLYCRAMEEIMSATTCECAPGPEDVDRPGGAAILNDCFEVRFLHRLVSFTITEHPPVPEATLVAILPPAPQIAPPLRAIFTKAEHPIRAGPFSPSASRAQLMVFLT